MTTHCRTGIARSRLTWTHRRWYLSSDLLWARFGTPQKAASEWRIAMAQPGVNNYFRRTTGVRRGSSEDRDGLFAGQPKRTVTGSKRLTVAGQVLQPNDSHRRNLPFIILRGSRPLYLQQRPLTAMARMTCRATPIHQDDRLFASHSEPLAPEKAAAVAAPDRRFGISRPGQSEPQQGALS